MKSRIIIRMASLIILVHLTKSPEKSRGRHKTDDQAHAINVVNESEQGSILFSTKAKKEYKI